MNKKINKKAIIVASFGTVNVETRKKCIYDMIQRVSQKISDIPVFNALTSRFIIKKIREMGESIYSIEEQVEQLIKDGYDEIIVQPSFITNGVEYNRLVEKMEIYKNRIILKVGKPILYEEKDFISMADILEEESQKDMINIFMGHGADEYDGKAYFEVQKILNQRGRTDIFIATVEGEPSFENIKKTINVTDNTKNVFLQPMMIVAGEHAKNDMIGDNEDSWKSQLQKDGYNVKYKIKGLGEIDAIAEIIKRKIVDEYDKEI